MAASSNVQKVLKHLEKVTADPSLPLDGKLLDRLKTDASIQVLSEKDQDQLLNQLSALIPQLNPALGQDPSPATTLVEVLIRPESYTFTRALSIDPAVDLTAGLAVGATPINHVILKLLQKASTSASDTSILAGRPELIYALVELWLGTPDTKVAEEALEVLEGMLNARFPAPAEGTAVLNESPYWPLDASMALENSLMWRRLVKDKDVYGLLFSMCGWKKTLDLPPSRSEKRAKTEAQARLLNFLLLYADHPLLHASQIADVEREYGVSEQGGLLEFGACLMVDMDDALMEANSIKWYRDFLGGDPPEGFSYPDANPYVSSPFISPSTRLIFLRRHGIHQRLIQGYLQPDTSNAYYILYVARYARHSPVSLLSDRPLVVSLLSHLRSYFQGRATSQWANQTVSVPETTMLSSVPPLALLPTSNTTSPLFSIPIHPPTAAAFRALAAVFAGFPTDAPEHDRTARAFVTQNRAAARALYYLYFHTNPLLWSCVARAAHNYAMFQDAAMAALQLISALIDAKWEPLPHEATVSQFHPDFSLPTEETLRSKCPRATIPRRAGPGSGTLPPTGLLALLSPPAYESLWEYLSKPAFAGRAGGVDSEASGIGYRVGRAKEDVLTKLWDQVNAALGVGALEESEMQTLKTVRDDLAQLKGRGRGVAMGEVGTLEL